MHAVQGERRIRRIQEGTDIERRAWLRRNPVGVRLYQLPDRLQAVALVDARQAQPVAGAVQTRDIFPGSEQLHRSVRTAVRFQALEDLCAVMQNACCRRDADRPEGYDACVMPSFLIRIIHQEHVVCKHGAEAELAGRRQLAGMRCFCHADVHRYSLLPE